MIIVSQDKDKILNFNNITQIYIGYAENNKKRSIRCETLTDTYVTLGIYETQERAKEVLQEIIKTHKISESYKYTRDVDLQSALTAEIETRNLILFRYEMPQE